MTTKDCENCLKPVDNCDRCQRPLTNKGFRTLCENKNYHYCSESCFLLRKNARHVEVIQREGEE